MSRDTVRLLRTGVAPADIVWEAVAWGAPRGEYGWDHGLAVMPDCLALLDLFPGDNAALPIVQAMAGLTETERFRPAQPLPPPRAGVSAHSRQEFLAAVEHERLADAQAIMLGALEAGLGPDDLLPWFADVVGAHHLSYGHGAIYVQKAFQLLELIGWHRANVVLGYLVGMHVYATREDLLPYMRPFMRDLQALDLSALAAVESTQAWTPDALVETLLAADKHAPLGATVNALEGGAGIGGVLDAVTLAVSERMLRYDTAGEADMSDDFRWLDITHGLTYANAARWIHARVPSPATQRLAMFTVFLAHYTGRHEWHTKVAPREVLARPAETIAAFGETSVRASMQDVSGAFIVQAHVIKTARAAWEEAERLGSFAPLDAVWRFMHSPRTDRFVASAVQQSIDFLSGRAARE